MFPDQSSQVERFASLTIEARFARVDRMWAASKGARRRKVQAHGRGDHLGFKLYGQADQRSDLGPRGGGQPKSI